MNKTAIITGANGQDGSYLAELLVSKGYNVVGMIRRSSVERLDNLHGVIGNNCFSVVEGDIADPSSVDGIIRKFQPDEFYNLAAQSHVATSFEQPTYTFNVNTVGVLNILEGIRHISPKTKFYQASTSEMFGSNYDERDIGPEHIKIIEKYQDEKTFFNPRSPYGVAKLAAHKLVNIYRDAYNIHASCGILFNHESPRRGTNFVTRKITKWLAELIYYNQDNFMYKKPFIAYNGKLKLGNIDSVRDWGHAEDYVEGMWLMLQQEKPDDYVLATGQCHSVKEFLNIAFTKYNLNYQDWIEIDPKFYRPADVVHLNGCADKAKLKLGWKPKKLFSNLVYEMIESDYKNVSP